MKNHGPGSPGGVATAFKVLQRAFAVLSPDQSPERRSIAVRTAFRGPGTRDGIEAVKRAVSRASRGLRDRAVHRPRAKRQSQAREEALLDELKVKLAAHVMAEPAVDVYEIAR